MLAMSSASDLPANVVNVTMPTYLFCVILPDAALLAIIAFADEHPIAVLAITFEAASFN